MKIKTLFFVFLVLIFSRCDRNDLYSTFSNPPNRITGVEIVYQLRDTGPAGGLIFYINPNADIDGWKYLEVAPASTEWTGVQWGSFNTLIGTDTGIGYGKDNTDIITPIVGASNAASSCSNLEHNGYSDWFLPSKDELWEACWNLVGLKYGNSPNPEVTSPLGGFNGNYLTSSESDAYNVTGWNLSNGSLTTCLKSSVECKVRAIRAF